MHTTILKVTSQIKSGFQKIGQIKPQIESLCQIIGQVKSHGNFLDKSSLKSSPRVNKLVKSQVKNLVKSEEGRSLVKSSRNEVKSIDFFGQVIKSSGLPTPTFNSSVAMLIFRKFFKLMSCSIENLTMSNCDQLLSFSLW